VVEQEELAEGVFLPVPIFSLFCPWRRTHRLCARALPKSVSDFSPVQNGIPVFSAYPWNFFDLSTGGLSDSFSNLGLYFFFLSRVDVVDLFGRGVGREYLFFFKYQNSVSLPRKRFPPG